LNPILNPTLDFLASPFGVRYLNCNIYALGQFYGQSTVRGVAVHVPQALQCHAAIQRRQTLISPCPSEIRMPPLCALRFRSILWGDENLVTHRPVFTVPVSRTIGHYAAAGVNHTICRASPRAALSLSADVWTRARTSISFRCQPLKVSPESVVTQR